MRAISKEGGGCKIGKDIIGVEEKQMKWDEESQGNIRISAFE